jgi:hypothetical protein
LLYLLREGAQKSGDAAKIGMEDEESRNGREA